MNCIFIAFIMNRFDFCHMITDKPFINLLTINRYNYID